MDHATIKLRRLAEPPLPMLESAGINSVLWRGISLDELGLALARNHHVQYIWNQLALTVSLALEDHAVALVEMGTRNFKPVILAQDGLHDELSRAISSADARCHFLQSPANHISNIAHSLANDKESCFLYEFIEHYWGWALTVGPEPTVYLMLFGPETALPHKIALDAYLLSSFIAFHVESEHKHRQLISELSAETQGRRITPALALKNRLDQWITLHDGTE